MSTIFWKKTFPLCFSISKCLPTTTQPPPPPFSDDRDHTQTTSSSSSSSVPIKTFNSSVYDIFAASSNSDDFFSSSDELCDSEILPPPALDLATVYASRRFFFSSPGQSNSIIESTTPDHASKLQPPLAIAERKTTATQFAGGVEVPKYSVDPFVDFRRSMQEMMEARDVLVDGRTDLEYLHELLLCFLALNPNETHKFIISAFTDIVVNLLSAPDKNRRHREIKIRRRRSGCVRRLSM
ncbi:transcription repressor OFP12-like [Humulus lupulus]|uniref:transcription repressor OFP12-like n=1 Tax=Humulus lupulus TaxID=3486 RepID=UPI002B40E58F|nr:transcription repressor OFP12-like [Humulus lupulus]